MRTASRGYFTDRINFLISGHHRVAPGFLKLIKIDHTVRPGRQSGIVDDACSVRHTFDDDRVAKIAGLVIQSIEIDRAFYEIPLLQIETDISQGRYTVDPDTALHEPGSPGLFKRKISKPYIPFGDFLIECFNKIFSPSQ